MSEPEVQLGRRHAGHPTGPSLISETWSETGHTVELVFLDKLIYLSMWMP